MRDRERGDQQDELPELPERYHQTKQEQQVVGPLQDVEESRFDEAPGGLVPARVEPDQARIPVQVEGAHAAGCGQEAERNGGSQAEPLEPGPDREVGTIRDDRILEQDVEQSLLPVQVHVTRQRRAGEVCERLLVGGEGLVGLERHAGIGDPRQAEAAVVFVELDIVGNPQRCRVPERRVGEREVEQARAAPRIVHVAHGFQRHADEKMQPLSLRLDEGMHRHVVRDVVGGRRRRHRPDQRRHPPDDHSGVDNGFPSIEHSGSSSLQRKRGSQ